MGRRRRGTVGAYLSGELGGHPSGMSLPLRDVVGSVRTTRNRCGPAGRQVAGWTVIAFLAGCEGADQDRGLGRFPFGTVAVGATDCETYSAQL